MVVRHPDQPPAPCVAREDEPRRAAPTPGVVEIGLDVAIALGQEAFAIAEAVAADRGARRHAPEIAAGTPAALFGGALGEVAVGQAAGFVHVPDRAGGGAHLAQTEALGERRKPLRMLGRHLDRRTADLARAFG